MPPIQACKQSSCIDGSSLYLYILLVNLNGITVDLLMAESTTPAFSGTEKFYDQLPKLDYHVLSMKRDCYVQGWRQFDNLSR